MKVKVKETQEIIDVEFAHTVNSGGQVEKIWQDSFSGKLYPSCLLEKIEEEKLVSLNKVCDLLCEMLHKQDIFDRSMVGTFEYNNVPDFIDDFRKKLVE